MECFFPCVNELTMLEPSISALISGKFCSFSSSYELFEKVKLVSDLTCSGSKTILVFEITNWDFLDTFSCLSGLILGGLV